MSETSDRRGWSGGSIDEIAKRSKGKIDLRDGSYSVGKQVSKRIETGGAQSFGLGDVDKSFV